MTDRRKQANEAERAAEEWWVNYPGVSDINPGTGAEYRAWRKSHQQAFLAGVEWKAERMSEDQRIAEEADARGAFQVIRLTGKLEDAEKALAFVVERENLAFAECSVAEAIWAKCKAALKKLRSQE